MKKNTEKDDLRFEIAFFEKLIAKNPHFIDALIALAHAYTRAGEYQKGLDIDLKLTELCSSSDIIFYNLACSYALLQMKNEAFTALKRCIALGYTDLDHLKNDPDLAYLKKDSRFSAIIESITNT